MKKFMSAVALMSLMFMPAAVFAGQGASMHSEIINVGNKVCPVSGQAIGSMGEGYKVEYNGKEYNLCCEMCVKDFKKNPEKYAKIAETDAQGEHADHAKGHKPEKMPSHEGHDSHGDHGHDDH